MRRRIFARLVAEALETPGLQAEIAEDFECAGGTVNRWASGDAQPLPRMRNLVISWLEARMGWDVVGYNEQVWEVGPLSFRETGGLYQVLCMDPSDQGLHEVVAECHEREDAERIVALHNGDVELKRSIQALKASLEATAKTSPDFEISIWDILGG